MDSLPVAGDITGAMTNVVYSDSTPAVSFAYDHIGRPLTITDGQGTRTNVYSATTLALIEEQLPDGTTLSHSQDALGRPSGITLGADYAATYGYDAYGRFGTMTANDGSFAATNTYAYLAGSDLPAGWAAGPVSVSRTYEPNRDLLAQLRSVSGTNTVSQYDYTNDALGRRTLRNDNGLAFGVATTNEFGYNLRSEIIFAMMGTNQYGYAYDPIGNRTSSTNGLEVTQYAANALNQYTNVVNGGTFAPSHDNDGNCTQLREWALTWDGENRLVRADNGTDTVEYGYDYMSRRVLRTTGSVTNRFDYDGWALIRERAETSGAVATNRYFYGPDLSGTLQGAGTIGGLWLRTGTGGPQFYTYDGNGNVSEILDDTGAIRGHYTYAPFGGLVAMTGDLAASNPIRFSAKRQDETTGFLYYGYRDLETEWGRWINRDIIAERGGLNLYAFVRNHPIFSIDLLGLQYGPGAKAFGLNENIWAIRSPSLPDEYQVPDQVAGPVSYISSRVYDSYRKDTEDNQVLKYGNDALELSFGDNIGDMATHRRICICRIRVCDRRTSRLAAMAIRPFDETIRVVDNGLGDASGNVSDRNAAREIAGWTQLWFWRARWSETRCKGMCMDIVNKMNRANP